MNTNSLLLVALVVAGLLLAIFASRLLIGWLQLMRLRFGVGEVRAVGRDDMPPAVATVLDSTRARLEALGFVYRETLLIDPRIRHGHDAPIWTDTLQQPATGDWALVHPTELPEPGLSAVVTFITHLGSRVLASENRRQYLLLPTPPDYETTDAQAASLAEHWSFHRRRVEAAASPAPLDHDALHGYLQQLRRRILEHGQQLGVMRREGDVWRLTAMGAWRYLRQMMAGTQQKSRLPPMTDTDTLSVRVQADAYAWRMLDEFQRNNTMSLRGKVLWFLVSAVAGITAFGAMTSWTIVPFLVGVLLVHEFGHALAMRAVGYRSLSVLVLPFLGAVAIGRKDDAGPWQKLLVLLAGPLPGLVVAVLLIRYTTGLHPAADWMISLGAIALVINYFNLLPFSPLDGGQIVDTFLFARGPRLRVIFHALSAAALVATGIAIQSTPLTAIGFVFALTVPAAWRRRRLLVGIGHTVDTDQALSRILQRIHEAASTRLPSFAKRAQTVRMLLPQVRGRKPGLAESLVGLAIYAATVSLPIAALWDTGVPRQIYAGIFGTRAVTTSQTPAIKDWQSELAKAPDPEARWHVLWQAGTESADNEDDEAARQWYAEALEEAEKLPPGDTTTLHLLDSRLALADYAEPDAAQATYLELLPELRRLPTAERWRLADALEALQPLLRDDQIDTQIAYLREAVDIRENMRPTKAYALSNDRLFLARLLDARHDATAAEALLRRNLDEAAGEEEYVVSARLLPTVWFLIAHDRAAEGEALLRSQPANSDYRLADALAWTLIAQGHLAGAREILVDEFARVADKRGWAWQQLELVLDLVHASADAPAEEARWLAKADEIRLKRGSGFDIFRTMIDSSADTATWEDPQRQARLAVIRRIADDAGNPE